MEVDPVYVVVADTSAKVPSRRSFLAAGFAFACGGVLGSTSGFVTAKWASANAAAGVRDAELERLRRLAVLAPVEELVEGGWTYLVRLADDYREDPELWFGLERLAARITEPGADARCRGLAMLAREVLAKSTAVAGASSARWAPLLEEVR